MCMPSLVRHLLYVFAFVMFHFLSLVIGEEEPNLSDAQVAWKEIYNKYREGFTARMNWEWEFRVHQQIHQGSARYEISLDGGFQSVRCSDYVPDRPNGLGCWNDRYRFSLEEDKSTHSYQVKNVEMGSCSEDKGWMEPLSACTVLFDGLYVYDAWIDKVVTDPTFKVLTANYISDPDTGQRLAEFTFEGECQVSETERTTGGRIILIPEYYWMVKEYQVDVESVEPTDEEKFFLKKAITYQMIEGIPFPEEVFLTCVLPDGTPIGMTRTAKVTEVTRQRLPKEQFYLSYYGFAEPKAVSADHLYRYIAIAVACFLIGLGLYLRHRQRAGRQTT